LISEPKNHSGLGLNAYITATSPIRKYYDLATQRQIRAVLGLEEPYAAEEIKQIIQVLEEPVSVVLKIQKNRHRYWLLKYLETMINRKEEAVVLFKKRNTYQVLIPEYMIECELPVSSGIELRPEDLIQIRIQHVNAKKGVLSIYMG
jgi:exoribonuclease-2